MTTQTSVEGSQAKPRETWTAQLHRLLKAKAHSEPLGKTLG